MVLYDLPAIRSVAWCGLQGSGMVFYDLPAIRSVAWCGLQGSGMVFYDLPAIRSVAWWGCKVVGWCSTICPPSGRWPGVAARLWGIAFLCLIVSFVIFNAQKLSYIGNFI